MAFKTAGILAEIDETTHVLANPRTILAFREPNDEHARGDGDRASEAQRLLGHVGARLKQLAAESRRKSPEQSFQDENEADGDGKIGHRCLRATRPHGDGGS
jgi:hypothetical protein